METQPILSCPRCGYSTEHRCNMKKHLLSKRILCPPTVTDISMEEICELYPHLITKQLKFGPKVFSCMECNKYFNTKQALSTHVRKSCKVSEPDITDRLLKLEKENRDLREKMDTILSSTSVNNTTNNNNTNNNTNCNNTTININAFCREDITHLLENRLFMDTVVKRREKGVLEFIKATYFDEDKPENRNVRITNYKMPYIDTYDGKRWLKCNKEEVLEDMLENSCSHIDEHYEQGKDRLLEAFSTSFVELVHDFMDRVKDRDEHKAFFDALKQRIHLLIINESKTVD